MHTFPNNFYWGAATASYQVEGWNENTDWAKAGKAGRVPLAGRLADHYHRYEEDFDIAKRLGHNAHRLSIEWSRIEPREGYFDEVEIEHYRKVLKALRKRKLEPFVTLWHFTLPLWFSESGGFERKDAPEIFARYCSFVTGELGDLCSHFATINEPNVYATHGYLYGAWPPFKRGQIGWKKIGKEDGTSERARATAKFKHFFTYLRVTKNLAGAHNAAYVAIKAVSPQVSVSVVKHVHYFSNSRNPLYWLRARLMKYLQTYSFMNKVVASCDEVGLNYYRSTYYGIERAYTYTDMDWKITPEDIYGALHMLARYKKPIYVAEAGLADRADSIRAQYIEKQIDGVSRALQDGIDIRAHLYWSLIDNYEWALGTEKCFGLVAINYETLERTIRPSAWRYKELIEQYSS